MNLPNETKYKLLYWLLDDICMLSKCEDCNFSSPCTVIESEDSMCNEVDVLLQARKVWGIE